MKRGRRRDELRGRDSDSALRAAERPCGHEPDFSGAGCSEIERAVDGAGMKDETPTPRTSTVVRLLQTVALALFFIPSNFVLAPVGATGYAASLAALACFAIWLVSSVWGLHGATRMRNPVRFIIAGLWVSALLSYVVRISPGTDLLRLAASDRWLVQLVAITGVALVASEGLKSVRDIEAVVSAICWGASFSGGLAAIQFWLHVDIAPLLGALPGFKENVATAAFSPRFGMYRVAGTALGPIDFGVSMGMVLPMAVWRATQMVDAPGWRRWTPVALSLLGVVLSVSRSSLLAVVVSMLVLVPMLPERERLAALVATPAAVVAIFAIVPGFFATMHAYVFGASSDPSVITRTDDYGFAMALIHDSPWVGHGAGWYVFEDALKILDNQYLSTAIELGMLGVVTLLGFLGGTALVALRARSRSVDPAVRVLGAAIAAAAFSGMVCSTAFDSMAFPVFACLQALTCGLSGAVWLISQNSHGDAPARHGSSLVVSHAE